MAGWRKTALGLLPLLAMVACGSPAPSTSGPSAAPKTPYTVRFGSVGGLTDAGIYLANELGYFKAAGIVIQMTRMAGGSDLTTAIASGNLDVAGIAVTAGLFNSVAGHIDLKIVGDKNSALRLGNQCISATHIVARNDLIGSDEAQTLSNLRGKKVGVTDKTSTATANLDFVLNRYGMSIKDVQLQVLSYPEITAALINGSIDAAVELEPYLSQAIDSGKVKDVSGECEVLPAGVQSATQVPIVFSESFIKEHRSVAQAFMVAYMRGVRAYDDAFLKGINKDRVIQLLAQASGQPVSLIAHEHVAGLDPNQNVNIAYLTKVENWFEQQGLLQAKIDASSLVDPSFAKEAVKELGTYRY